MALTPIKFALDAEHRCFVDYRGPNSWAVMVYGLCMSTTGELSYEPSPSNRDDEFIQTHRFASPEEAEKAFLSYKSKIRINGKVLE